MNTVFLNWYKALRNKPRLFVLGEILCIIAVASMFLVVSPRVYGEDRIAVGNASSIGGASAQDDDDCSSASSIGKASGTSSVGGSNAQGGDDGNDDDCGKASSIGGASAQDDDDCSSVSSIGKVSGASSMGGSNAQGDDDGNDDDCGSASSAGKVSSVGTASSAGKISSIGTASSAGKVSPVGTASSAERSATFQAIVMGIGINVSPTGFNALNTTAQLSRHMTLQDLQGDPWVVVTLNVNSKPATFAAIAFLDQNKSPSVWLAEILPPSNPDDPSLEALIGQTMPLVGIK